MSRQAGHFDVKRPNRALGSSPSYGSLERQADHASSELRNVNPTPLNGGNRPRPLSVNSAVHLYKRLRPQGVACLHRDVAEPPIIGRPAARPDQTEHFASRSARLRELTAP